VDGTRTRVFILGDPDQLPSIHSGSVLADIVAAAESGGPLAPCHLRRTFNYRSGEQLQLAGLVDAVRTGDVPTVYGLIAQGGGIGLIPSPSAVQMNSFVRAELGGLIQALTEAPSPEAALAAATRSRMVCMLREGTCGADEVNRLATQLALTHVAKSESSARHYHGQPLIVTKNDHRSGLYNGDCGVVIGHGAARAAWFAGVAGEGPRRVSLQSLPPCESAYALTVHRAQGSEYDTVTLLLPPWDHPMLSRELFYTGISRARMGVRIASSESVVRAALGRTVSRASGLAARLA
jgi:exodeoxyribonuclease V alpha subunit